jgi:hypothetical protein
MKNAMFCGIEYYFRKICDKILAYDILFDIMHGLEVTGHGR